MEELLKTQLLTISAVKNDANLFNIIYLFFMMSIMDILIKSAKHVYTNVEGYISNKIKNKTNQIINVSTVGTNASIIYERYYPTQNNESPSDNQQIVDAILDYTCDQDSCLKIKFRNRYIVNNTSDFDLTNDIKARLIDVKVDENTKNINFISFELYSNKLSLSKIKKWVNKIYDNYQLKLKNNMGDKKYFFSEVHQVIPKNIDGTFRMELAPKKLSFNMTQFDTSKSLNNLFGDHIETVKRRVDHFVNNPEWFYEKGIPHTLGILLHGPPGCGKTSLIKAIAKDTKRHIFNLKLTETTTQNQINNLFYKESVEVMNNNEKIMITIPLEQRIYILEDIDCLSNIVIDRREQSNQIQSVDDRINLNYLLNLIDGVLEIPGRILIMTTNYPEKLDKALIRPGRVDLNIHVGKATKKMICEFFKFFYGNNVEIPNEWDNIFTPAEISSYCNLFRDSCENCFNLIKEEYQIKMNEETFETSIEAIIKKELTEDLGVKEDLGFNQDLSVKESEETIIQKFIPEELRKDTRERDEKRFQEYITNYFNKEDIIITKSDTLFDNFLHREVTNNQIIECEIFEIKDGIEPANITSGYDENFLGN